MSRICSIDLSKRYWAEVTDLRSKLATLRAFGSLTQALSRVRFHRSHQTETWRSVSAKSCFSEKEHAEVTRCRDPEPRPKIGAPYRAQARVKWERWGQAGCGQAARSRRPERTHSQERSGSTQEPARQSRKIKKRTPPRRPCRQLKKALRWSAFLHRSQLAPTPLAIPFGGVVRRPTFRALERLVLLRPRILAASTLRDRRRRGNGSS